jgi:hypothetical protein
MATVAFSTIASCTLHRDDGQVDLAPHVVRYQDNATIGSVPNFSMALPPRIKGELTLELIRPGDVILTSLKTRIERRDSELATVCIGAVTHTSETEAISDNALQNMVVVRGKLLPGYLANDSINYWEMIGSMEGYFRSLSLVPVDALTLVGLDAALSVFMDNVVANTLRIQTAIGGFNDTVAYSFKTLPTSGRYDTLFANYEGSFWQFLDTFAETPLHELYAGVFSRNELEALSGNYMRRAQVFNEDQAQAGVVVRPSPFPFATPDGQVDFSEWTRLPINDLTANLKNPTGVNLAASADATVSFVKLQPKNFVLDEMSAVLFVMPLVDETAWQRFGYKPLNWSTWLFTPDMAKEKADEYFDRLNWRMATQNSNMHRYMSGSFPLRLSPRVRIGTRAIFNWHATRMMGYITGVSHTFNHSGARSTTVTVSRILPERDYSDPAFFRADWKSLPALKDIATPINDIRKHDEPGPTQ